jgi:hypothetical protein
VKKYLQPPQRPDECVFAKTTACVSADLEKPITPCQYGGDPDCSQCGCMASVGFAALADHRIAGVLPLRTIFNASFAVGDMARRSRRRRDQRRVRIN